MRRGAGMSSRPYDLPSLVAGIAFTLFGLLLLLNATDAVDLGFGLLAPSFLAVCGSILVATGLSAGEGQDGVRREALPPLRDLRDTPPHA